MRFGFVTSVKLGLSCMEAIYEVGCELHLAITLTDSQARTKSGRIYLDSFCKKNDIDLYKTEHINEQGVVDRVKSHSIDWLFIIGWSQIAGSDLLDSVSNGVIGMHPTLLPEGRGRASIPWAILKKLPETGVTMFKVDAGVDTGPIIDQLTIKLDPAIDAGKLYKQVDQAHIDLIKKNINLLKAGEVTFRPQNNENATVWAGRRPEDGQIDLKGSVRDAELLVRALTRPYPGAFFVESISGKKIIVWKAFLSKYPTSKPFLKFDDGILVLEEFE